MVKIALTLRPIFTLEMGRPVGRQQPRRALRARGCRSAAAGQTTSGKGKNATLRSYILYVDNLLARALNAHAFQANFEKIRC